MQKTDTISHKTKTITSINSNSLVFSLPKQWERAGKSRNQTQISFVFSVHSNQTMLKENTNDKKQIRTKKILTHWLVTEKILKKKKKKTQFSSNFKLNSDFWLFQLKQTKTKRQFSFFFFFSFSIIFSATKHKKKQSKSDSIYSKQLPFTVSKINGRES